MSRTTSEGRHEYGQNFLSDHQTIRLMVDKIAEVDGPIIEIGPGDGAITVPLAQLQRSVIAVEVDPRRVRRLRKRLPSNVRVEQADYLRFNHPVEPHVVIGNIPFHITTAVLRKLLKETTWTHALLLVQWEVARRRAGLGGATMLTAEWWPWYDFSLLGRVSACAFRPVPNVDGGLLWIIRRADPPVDDQMSYQRLVQRVFTGKGRGLSDILRHSRAFQPAALSAWLRKTNVSSRTLPKDLTANHWFTLWQTAKSSQHSSSRTIRSHASPSDD